MRSTIAALIAAVVVLTVPASAAVTFSLTQSGSGANVIDVMPGSGFILDLYALNITADVVTGPNLDSFTYRIQFPNQDFGLTSNVFAPPFDNAVVPGGFNGSVPWTGLPISITNGADAGSPGATPFAADIYRTTASETGVPAVGAMVLIETLGLRAPNMLGSYDITLDIIEAADNLGSFHTVSVTGPFTVNVVPLPASLPLFVFALAALAIGRSRLRPDSAVGAP